MLPSQAKEGIIEYWRLFDVSLVHLKNDPVFATVVPSKIFEAMAVGVPILSFNRAPRIKDESGGFWRRIMPVIFPTVLAAVPEADQRTPAWIKAMIEEEAVGILTWMLDGWIDWRHRGGFEPPPEVVQKKALLRASADPVGTFLAECVDLATGMSIAAAELHKGFTAWCAGDGTEAMNIRPFKKVMIDKGFNADKTGGKMKWRGIAWKSDPSVQDLLRDVDSEVVF